MRTFPRSRPGFGKPFIGKVGFSDVNGGGGSIDPPKSCEALGNCPVVPPVVPPVTDDCSVSGSCPGTVGTPDQVCPDFSLKVSGVPCPVTVTPEPDPVITTGDDTKVPQNPEKPKTPKAPRTPKAPQQCTSQPLVLNEVFLKGSRVVYNGYADTARTKSGKVSLTVLGRSVGTAKVSEDGSFAGSFANASWLRKAYANNPNAPRLQASAGKLRTEDYKLTRRLATDSLRVKGRTVTLTAQAVRPFMRTRQDAFLLVRYSCSGSWVKVPASEKLSASGRVTFSFRVPAKYKKASVTRAFFRVQSSVQATDKKTGKPNGLKASTFTSPKAVLFK